VRVWKRFFLGGCEEPPIYRGGWRKAVVRHTCDRRLQNREKFNRWWDIRGNVGKETLSNVAERLKWSLLLRAPLSLRRDVLGVISPNVAFGLGLLLGVSSWVQVFDRSRTVTLVSFFYLFIKDRNDSSLKTFVYTISTLIIDFSFSFWEVTIDLLIEYFT